MHVYLVENPAAGRERTRAWLTEVTHALLEAGHEVTAYRGEEPGDLARHVAGLRPGELDVLVVAGGDGTLRSIVNARPSPLPWPVAVLPAGTANLVAREAGTHPLRDPVATAKALLEAERWGVDLLALHGSNGVNAFAVTNVSAGVDGAIVHAVTNVRNRRGGKGGYEKWVRPVLGVVGDRTRPPVSARVDGGEPVEGANVVVQNARVYGGLFRLAPEARLDSRRLDVVVFRAGTARDLARLGLKSWLRTVHRDKQVRVLHGRRVHLEASRPVAVQADGDPAGTTDLDVTLVPDALRLLRV